MVKRIATASVLIVVLLALVLFGRLLTRLLLDFVVFVCAAVAVHETHGAFKRAGYSPIGGALVAATVSMVPLTVLLGPSGLIVTVAVGALTALSVFTMKHNYELKDMLATAFILVYPLALTGIFSLINHGYGGLLGILLAIVVPVMTDTMAYFAGITIGGKKLCPNISPKKTVAGAVGGIIGGILGAFLIFVLFDWTGALADLSEVDALLPDKWLSLAVYLVIGYLGGFICEMGDLAASWIKRKAGIKDFGKIFPGHGGIMDRLDSILFMLPVVYTLFALLGALL